jgi:hypothetical protein
VPGYFGWRRLDCGHGANERASEATRTEWGAWGPTSERGRESEGRRPSE